MSNKHLGENFDIHGGGVDLIFPHHTNEIAQAKCAFKDSNYAQYWVHNGTLTVNKQKMSKSQKGRVISEETKQKMRDTKKDKRKITDEQIKEIRENLEGLLQCEFAIKFNVSKQLICNIIHCKGAYALPI
jgi:DNA-binding transcriptional regulator YiaG